VCTFIKLKDKNYSPSCFCCGFFFFFSYIGLFFFASTTSSSFVSISKPIKAEINLERPCKSYYLTDTNEGLKENMTVKNNKIEEPISRTDT
jgi:hypothetical protein